MTKKDTLPYTTVLVVDTSERDKTSIALITKDGKPTIITEDVRAQELPQLIDSLLENNKLLPKNIDALALVKKEGSMTAIRIGTAVVNTFSWLNKIHILEVAADNISDAVEKTSSGDVYKTVKTSLPYS